MVGFMLFWGSSIVISYGFDVARYLSYFKLFADNGFKVDFLNLSKPLPEEINVSGHYEQVSFQPTKKIFYFIPGVNLLVTLKNIINHDMISQIVCDAFFDNGYLKEMTEEEKNRYAKHPNGITALRIARDAINLYNVFSPEEISVCEIVVDGETSIFTFACTDDGKFAILSVEGPASQLSQEEQSKIFSKSIVTMINSSIVKYGEEETLNILTNGGDMDYICSYDKETGELTSSKLEVLRPGENLEEEKIELNQEAEENKKVKKRILKKK